MDFGISKMQDSTRTTTGVVMGTPYYMAPEQVLGRKITPQVDVYAFGVLLFELMTGSRPIVGDTVERIFYQILQEPLNIEPMRQAEIPDPIIDLVTRCNGERPGQAPARLRRSVCAHPWHHSRLGRSHPAHEELGGKLSRRRPAGANRGLCPRLSRP